MNGARTIFRRKGYLLTALAAAVLLAASSGTAYAQRVSIGFVETSGDGFREGVLETPIPWNRAATGSPCGLSGLAIWLPSRGSRYATARLGNVTITPSAAVNIGRGLPPPVTSQSRSGEAMQLVPTGRRHGRRAQTPASGTLTTPMKSFWWSRSRPPAHPMATGWRRCIELKLDYRHRLSFCQPGRLHAHTVEESHVAPVAKFGQRDFTLSEQSTRVVSADIKSGITGVPLPGDYTAGALTTFAGEATSFAGKLSVRVSNHGLVTFTMLALGGKTLSTTGNYFASLWMATQT